MLEARLLTVSVRRLQRFSLERVQRISLFLQLPSLLLIEAPKNQAKARLTTSCGVTSAPVWPMHDSDIDLIILIFKAYQEQMMTDAGKASHIGLRFPYLVELL